MTDSSVSAITSSSTASTGAQTTLFSNYNDFLKLLTTQLQHQDPTSPMDTNQFTQQLVEYSQVEQQINTNTNLTNLIQLTQGNALEQSSSLVGKTVDVQSDQLSLQGGSAGLHFGARAPASVAIGVYTQAGVKVRDATGDTTANGGVWTWDGKDNAGRQLPDGAYRVAVTDAAGGTAAVPFNVTAMATGLAKSGSNLKLELGALQVDFGAIQSVANK